MENTILQDITNISNAQNNFTSQKILQISYCNKDFIEYKAIFKEEKRRNY